MRNPKKFVKNVGKSVGKTLDNKFVQAAGAAALAATGVGAPAAAGILAGNQVTSKALQGKSVPKALPSIARDAAINLATAKLGSMAKGARGIPKGGMQIPGLPSGVNINGFTSGAANAAQTGAANMAGGGSGIYGMLGSMGTKAAAAKAATARAPGLMGGFGQMVNRAIAGGAGGQSAGPSFASRASSIGRNFISNGARNAFSGDGAAPENGAQPPANKNWFDSIMGVFNKPGALEATGNVVGGYLEGQAAGKIADEDRKWDREKFGREQQLTEGGAAVGLGRDLSMAPMRDQAMFMLQQRMGLSPDAFKPRDMFNESTSAATPQLGGIDLEELKRRNAGYTPGKGGYNTDIQRLLLQKLGYGGGNA